MGKGAPLYLNGAYILSHLGPYSDGGTAKIRKMPSKKFGALRAQCHNIKLCVCVCVREETFIQFPPAKILR